MIHFSVIIPLYNKANFVKKTIESILSQTYENFEIVIVNDGSTDNSMAVVSEITDPRIRLFTKENGGVSAARNFGIEKAQYEYITFLDADDLWFPDYLETIKGMIEQYPQAGIFGTAFTTINRLGVKIDRTIDKLPAGGILLTDNYCRSIIKREMSQLWTCTICVKKELFHKTGGFRVGVITGEDQDMWLRLSFNSTIVWKNEAKALYIMVSENNLTKAYTPQKSFPYWEWYSYSSSCYLKLYTNRNLKALIKESDYKNKLYILKMNWRYILFHYFYVLLSKIK